MLPKGGIHIKKILWVFLFLPFFIGACNYFSDYILSVDNITIEATKCSYSVTVTGERQKKPDILITIGQPPANSKDGMIMKSEVGEFFIDRDGTVTIYFTLVSGRRLLSTPLATVVRVFNSPITAPIIKKAAIRDGNIFLSLQGQSEGIKEYKVKIGSYNYFSKSGVFAIPLVSNLDVPIKCFSIREDGAISEPAIANIDLSENKKPSIDLILPEYYDGNKIPLELHDDWTAPEKLIVRAFADDIPLLFDGKALFPLFEIPGGEHLIEIEVIDEAGLSTKSSFQITIKKALLNEIAELYIEEGGTFRIASWKLPSSVQNAVLQVMGAGEWTDIMEIGFEGSARIPSEYISDMGDIYRLSPRKNDSVFLPSVPVFAKLEQSRRVTSSYIVSLYGKDVTLPSGGVYNFQGNIAVKSGSLLRIESSTSINLSRKSTLLVNGVLEIDGRRGKVTVSSFGSPAIIHIGRKGTFIARNVDFQNVELVADKGAVIVLENCEMNADVMLDVSSAQIYSSNITGSFKINNLNELYIFNSHISGSFESGFVKKGIVSNTQFDSKESSLSNSNIKFYNSEFSTGDIDISGSSHVYFYNSSLKVKKGIVNNASELYIEGTEIFCDEKLFIGNFSRIVMPEKVQDEVQIEKDNTSEVFLYNSGD